MMTASVPAVATLLLLPLLPGLEQPSGRDHLAFAPKVGSVLHTRVESDLRTEWVSLQVRMGGQEIPSTYLPKIEMNVELTGELDVFDTLHEVSGGACHHLQRRFEKLGSEMTFDMSMDGPQPMQLSAEGEGETELEGKLVDYRWNASQETYDAAWSEDSGGSQEVLEESWIDLSLAGFLPEADAEEDLAAGDAWTVDAGFLGGVLFFENGAYMELDASGEGAERLIARPDEFEGPTGDLDVRLEKLDSEGGQALAVLAIEGTVETWESMATDLEAVPVASGDATEETTTVYELEGTVVWNLDEGRAMKMELNAELERTAITVKDNTQSLAEEYESEARMRGTAAWRLVCRSEQP